MSKKQKSQSRCGCRQLLKQVAQLQNENIALRKMNRNLVNIGQSIASELALLKAPLAATPLLLVAPEANFIATHEVVQ